MRKLSKRFCSHAVSLYSDRVLNPIQSTPSKIRRFDLAVGLATGVVAYLGALALFVKLALFEPGGADDALSTGMWLGNAVGLAVTVAIVAITVRLARTRQKLVVGLRVSVVVGVVALAGFTVVATGLSDRFGAGCPCEPVIDRLVEDGWTSAGP